MIERTTPILSITSLHSEPDNRAITGFRFEVRYDGAQAKATILVETPSLDPERPDTFASELRRLGNSLLEAAQSPQCILWHLRDER